MQIHWIATAAVCALALSGPLWSGDARAETRTITVAGDTRLETGDGAQPDLQEARVRAIDVALADAIGQALADLIDERARRDHRKTLNRDIVRRARRYVARIKVIKEGVADDRYQVQVEAHIDLDRLRGKLEELGIENSADPQAAESRPRPQVTILAHSALGETVETTFGEQARPDGAVGQALSTLLHGKGFQVIPATGAEVPAARERPARLPLTDEGAAAIARSVSAGGVLVVGVEARPKGTIRATSLSGAVARATVRVLDVSEDTPAMVAQADVQAAGYGESPEKALTHASAEAARRAVLQIAAQLVAFWPLEQARDNAIAIEVRGYRDWSDIRALTRHLGSTHGITRVWPQKLGRRGVVLAAVTDIGRRRLASAIRRAPLRDASVKTAARGRGVLVTIKPHMDSFEDVGNGEGMDAGGQAP